jgi:type IV secretory pathway VirB2 component (pilin)
MLNIALIQPRQGPAEGVEGVMVLATTGQRRQFIDKLPLLEPPTIRLMTALIMVGILLVLPAGSALAQDEITTAFTEVVETITGIIQGLAVVVGIAGLSIWGLARIARPIFPELSNLTQQYIGSLVIGVIVVFVAATVVEGLASAVGG